MTLDEEIKHVEEVAEENQAIVDACDYYGDNMAKCEKCAKEHRQLAEWLKDYKRLLEQEPFMNKPCIAHQICHEDKVKVLDKIRAEILNFKEKCNASDYLGCGILEIIDKYKAESEEEE